MVSLWEYLTQPVDGGYKPNASYADMTLHNATIIPRFIARTGKSIYDSFKHGITPFQIGEDPYLRRERDVEDAFNVAGAAILGNMPSKFHKLSIEQSPELSMEGYLQRAKEQGYLMDEPYYHGTNASIDFEGFDKNAVRHVVDIADPYDYDSFSLSNADGISITSNPKDANKYINRAFEKDPYFDEKVEAYPELMEGKTNEMIGRPRIFPLRVRGPLWDPQNEAHLKDAIEYLRPTEYMPGWHSSPEDFTAQMRKRLTTADENGDAWGIVQHLLGGKYFTDRGFTGARTIEHGSPTIQMFDMSAIRSPHAKFDPAKKNSTNLLASLLAGIGLSKTYKEERQ